MPPVPDYKKATRIASELLNKYDIREPVVRVSELAQRNGYTIVYFNPDEEDLRNVSGFLDQEHKCIYVNNEDVPTRQLFTVAHELGHALLNHPVDQVGVLYRYATPIDKDPIEQEANCFAANLLVPEKMLIETMQRYELTVNDIETLAQLFGVSTEVMKYRLQWMQKNGKI